MSPLLIFFFPLLCPTIIEKGEWLLWLLFSQYQTTTLCMDIGLDSFKRSLPTSIILYDCAKEEKLLVCVIIIHKFTYSIQMCISDIPILKEAISHQHPEDRYGWIVKTIMHRHLRFICKALHIPLKQLLFLSILFPFPCLKS